MRLNLSVELCTVSAAFRPPSTEIGFIRCDEASAWWIRFHVWTCDSMRILQHRPVVPMKIARDVLEGCALCMALTDRRPLRNAVALQLFTSRSGIQPSSIDTLGRQELRCGRNIRKCLCT